MKERNLNERHLRTEVSAQAKFLSLVPCFLCRINDYFPPTQPLRVSFPSSYTYHALGTIGASILMLLRLEHQPDRGGGLTSYM